MLLVDAGCALLFERRIHALLPRWNIRTIALLEAGIAIALLVWHFRHLINGSPA